MDNIAELHQRKIRLLNNNNLSDSINNMIKVKVIDESHEKDLERSINTFLSEGNYDIIDIKYQVAIAVCGEEQIYCFSAMIIYN